MGAEGLSDTRWPNRFGNGGETFALESRVEREFTLDEFNHDAVTAMVHGVFNYMAEAYGLPALNEARFRVFAKQ